MPTSTGLANQSFIQRWAVPIAFGFFVAATGVYIFWFRAVPISSDVEHWGQLGDYLGGLINPIVGLITIWLLSTSLRQNQLALSQSQAALNQSQAALQQAREELSLTRDSLEQSRGIQVATEAALRAQVVLAEETRDMQNIIALWTAQKARSDKLLARIREVVTVSMGTNDRLHHLEQEHRDVEARVAELETIINAEMNRLINRALPKFD